VTLADGGSIPVVVAFFFASANKSIIGESKFIGAQLLLWAFGAAVASFPDVTSCIVVELEVEVFEPALRAWWRVPLLLLLVKKTPRLLLNELLLLLFSCNRASRIAIFVAACCVLLATLSVAAPCSLALLYMFQPTAPGAALRFLLQASQHLPLQALRAAEPRAF
jgi:hypothetical protein